MQRIESPVRLKAPESKSARHFNEIVAKEETKFRKCCKIWNKVLEENSAPENVQGQILSAIGQANLFQNKRFKQFKELIELHKDETAEKKATEEDLQGFWEMIHFQVEDVHKRFQDLEDLRAKNWEEEKAKTTNVEPVVPRAKTLKPQASKNKKPMGVSKFKLFRQQQMLAKKSTDDAGKDGVMIF